MHKQNFLSINITNLIESYEKVEYNQVFFSKQDLLILINFNFAYTKDYYFLLSTLQLTLLPNCISY
ncbi:hypothetical protein C4097_18770 [Clostridioides difficile]|nr:hypothetical protein [Clostridioides difficile]